MSVILMKVVEGKPQHEWPRLFEVNKEQSKVLQVFSEFERNSLRENGIAIPEGMRAQYEGKAFVKLDDPDFYKAFSNIYYKQHYAGKSEYRWFKSN